MVYAALLGLGSLAAGVIALLGWFCLGDDLAHQSAQVQRVSSRLAQQRKAPVLDLALLGRQQAALADAVSVLALSWVDPAAGPALWLQVEAASLAQGLKVESFQPVAPVVLPDRVEQSATLRLKGRYAQLVGWANALAAESPAVGLSRLSLQMGSDGLLQAEAVLVRYQRLSPASTQPQASRPTPSSAAARLASTANIPDPFAAPLVRPDPAPAVPPSASRRPDPLQAWPLADLRLVGILQQQGQAVALVQVAGRVHAVRVGDGLGQNQGEVVQIDDGGLVLREWTRQPEGAWKPREVRLQVGQRAVP